MKTTLDLPDDLLAEAKIVAAQRRTTLKAMVEHALRREITTPPGLQNSRYARNELGFLVLRKGTTLTPHEKIRKLQEAVDKEDLQRALKGGS